MPKRGSSQLVREQNYKWLVFKYGERCIICGAAPPPGQKLQIDEISYAPEDFDDPANISLVCAGCNSMLKGVDARDEHRPEQHRKIIEFIQRMIDITKPEHLAEEIADGLEEKGWLELSKIALLESLKETQEKLYSAEMEVTVWNSGANRHN